MRGIFGKRRLDIAGNRDRPPSLPPSLTPPYPPPHSADRPVPRFGCSRCRSRRSRICSSDAFSTLSLVKMTCNDVMSYITWIISLRLYHLGHITSVTSLRVHHLGYITWVISLRLYHLGCGNECQKRSSQVFHACQVRNLPTATSSRNYVARGGGEEAAAAAAEEEKFMRMKTLTKLSLAHKTMKRCACAEAQVP